MQAAVDASLHTYYSYQTFYQSLTSLEQLQSEPIAHVPGAAMGQMTLENLDVGTMYMAFIIPKRQIAVDDFKNSKYEEGFESLVIFFRTGKVIYYMTYLLIGLSSYFQL